MLFKFTVVVFKLNIISDSWQKNPPGPEQVLIAGTK
jgi:hypothetical protein